MLLDILHDPHERFVPEILDWSLLAYDISRDIPVSHASSIFLPRYCPLPLTEVDRIFRLYTKSIGRYTIYRVEESVTQYGAPPIALLSPVDIVNNYII